MQPTSAQGPFNKCKCLERLPDGSNLLTIQGPAGREVNIEASVALKAWRLQTSVTNAAGKFEIKDLSATVKPQQLDRAALAPDDFKC
ncbi:MAG: hypothetical protein HY735_22730 [Verrucomicrobia bacterium]|nr:hypothetical protein [Verrucomicrobiota bacterium]